MHRFFEIPGQLVGLALLLLGGLWAWGWRRSADPEERKLASFGGVLAAGGLVLLTGIAGTLRWPAYGLCMAAGCLALAALSIHWARQQKLIGMEQMLEVLLVTGVCGLLGARTVFLIEEWDTHFGDRAPTLAVGLLAPLAKGDTLQLQTHTAAPFEIAFQGDETTLGRLKERLEAGGAAHDLLVSLRTTQHRGDERIEVTERGLLLRTQRRGTEAVLRVVGGSAAPKLGLIPRTYTKGVAIPLSAIFDLREGGLTYFGSVIGVLISAALYLRWRKISLLRMLDLVAPALPLGLFFGRLGCLTNGCCWGREAGANALLSVRFPPWSPAWSQFAAERTTCADDQVLMALTRLASQAPAGTSYDQLVSRLGEANPELVSQAHALAPRLGTLLEGTPPVHATQLYEGLTVLLIFFLVLAYRRWLQRRVGQAFALVVLLQAPVRFVVEHFRRDHEVFFRVAGYPLTESQTVALVMFAAAVPAMLYFSRQGRLISEEPGLGRPPEPAPGAAPEGGAPAGAAPPAPEDAAPQATG
ncbi:MAG: prolipoprotein diacylglyceryl transferase [Planctomycetota bacterium]